MMGFHQMMSESHRLTARAEEFSSNFPRPDALEGARQIGPRSRQPQQHEAHRRRLPLPARRRRHAPRVQRGGKRVATSPQRPELGENRRDSAKREPPTLRRHPHARAEPALELCHTPRTSSACHQFANKSLLRVRQFAPFWWFSKDSPAR